MRLLLLIMALLTGRAAADTISVPVPTCTRGANFQADGHRFRADGYASISSPGDPALPYKEVHIVLPPSADPESVSVRLSGVARRIAQTECDVPPAPPLAASTEDRVVHEWGRNKTIRNNRNILVYQKPAYYPAINVELASIGVLRTWQIATVRYYPYRYHPVRRILEEVTSANILVSYRTSPQPKARPATSVVDSEVSGQLANLVVNYAQARQWYSADGGTPLSYPAEPQSLSDYVIITTSAIVAGSSKLQDFVSHKTERGFSVQVITESDWGGGTGDAAATNIRSYLQGHYLTSGIKYVLLIGNPDPVAGDVPMKMLWPRYTSSTYREAPSDYFYADLTGDWDLSGNGYYGEETYDFGPGGIDRFADVIVGRIPFYGSSADLDSILQKTIDYESGASPEGWMRKVLLSMKPSDSSTPGYQLGEAIRTQVLPAASMEAVRSYDSEYGLTPPPEHTPCTYEGVLSAWQQRTGFHFWWTHGGETMAQDIFTTANCQYLDDSYPSFTFQCSCHNACPENSTNLAYSLLKRGAIVTDAATRVSWYYVGETEFAVSDSNAGMTYTYARKLIGEHLPCGDAHFAMMVTVPNEIWMNHCVFNLYGDPSVRYPMAPLISHTPLANTDSTTEPYVVVADVTTTAPAASGYPRLMWNTDGGAAFNEVQMNPLTQISYSAAIPGQPYGTTVYYYIMAADADGLSSTYPADAPQSLVSFEVMEDVVPPTIAHAPLANTADKFGPYVIDATVTDDMGIAEVSLYYSINGGAFSQTQMLCQSGNLYQGSIPGPTQSGDTISYYIEARDSSLNANTTRVPAAPGSYSFHIGTRVYVAVFNSTASPSYFLGGNINAWQSLSDIFTGDPAQRFQVSVITNLVPSPGTVNLEGQDVLVLPDNGVPTASHQAVSDWFQPGKVIITLDSSTCYAAYCGWMWSAAAGTSGYGTYWDYTAGTDDQQIWAQDPITFGYTVGQIIGSAFGDAVFNVSNLPADAHVLTVRSGDSSRAYAVYRDVPGRGRLVILGPYIRPVESQYSIIREAAIGPAQARQLNVQSPNGGETFATGDQISISFACTGIWQESDRIALEYTTGLDPVWLSIPGAESLRYGVGSFQWDTADLHGSHLYRVRAVWTGGGLSDESDGAFTVLPTVDILAAKWIDDGELIKLSGKIVTCGVVGMAYVEEPNRRAGIRVNYGQALAPSALVDVVGTMDSVGGERLVNAEYVDVIGTGAQIKPFATKASALGGSAFGLQDPTMEYRWDEGQGGPLLLPALGLNNIGLLVRLWGVVTAVGDDFFYLDDGSGCCDSSMNPGVRVICSDGPSVQPGQRVIVDAVSSTWFDGAITWRALALPDRQSVKVR